MKPSSGPLPQPGCHPFLRLTDQEKLQFLRTLNEDAISEWGPQAPGWFADEQNPVIAGTLLKIFGAFWSREQLVELASTFFRLPGSVRLAALDLLSDRQPAALARCLPKLLTSDDPKVHLLAIRGLQRIDVPEARKYLEDFLFHEDRPARELAIIDLLQFPFPDIKPVLFTFFSIETDHELLERAGTLFEMNPDPEVPFRLLEIADSSSARKALLVKRIAKGALELLERSGVLGDRFAAYLNHLLLWKRKRRAGHFLQEIFTRMQCSSEEEWSEFDAAIRQALRNPIFRDLFPMVFSWGLTPSQRAFFSRFQDLVPPLHQDSSAVVSPPAAATPEQIVAETGPSEKLGPAPSELPEKLGPTTLHDLLLLPPVAQKRFFSRFVAIDEGRRWEMARQVLAAPTASRKTKAAALRWCGQAGRSEFQDLAEQWLASADEDLQIGALTYLGEVNSEAMGLHLRKCLHAASPRVKLEAVRLLRTLDPREALAVAKTMLEPRHRAMHEAGLAAIACFEFSLVREVVADFLLTPISQANFEAGLMLFRANPDRESLYQVVRLEALVSSPPLRILVEEARDHLTRDLVELKALSHDEVPTLVAQFRRRLSEEEEQKRQPAKDYAFERVRRVPPVQEGGGAQEFFPIMFSMISENRERIMVVGVLLAVLWSGVYLFSGRTRQKVVPRSEAGQESRRVSRVIGRVSSTSDEPPGVFMVTPQHQTLLVLGAASQLLHASPGQSFELEISTATIKPFGVTMVKMGRVIRELGKGQGQR
jgi:hypothetical protein